MKDVTEAAKPVLSVRKIEELKPVEKDDTVNNSVKQIAQKQGKKAAKIKRSETDLAKNRVNLKGILQYSNATPLRSRGDIGFVCCICDDQYPDPAVLKKHTKECHDYELISIFVKERQLNSVRMDITGLQCNICSENLHDLEQLVNHLVDVHEKNLFKNIISFLTPIKFEGDALQCYICRNTYTNFKSLIEHMNIHCRNFVCNVCDAGFLAASNLRSHMRRHDIGTYSCEFCSKIFNTILKKQSHERTMHKLNFMMYKCGICNERFNGHQKKIIHLSEVHGMDPVVLKCNACDKTFINKRSLRVHTQKDHLLLRPHRCTECDLSFYKKIWLDEHMLKHTGVKAFKCEICLKSYGRKMTLREHMRIHQDDRRFKCEHCGMAFVQRCSWRGHMKTKHGVIV